MSGSDEQSVDTAEEVLGGPGWKRKRVWVSGVGIGLIALMFLAAWLSRERLADEFISDQLAEYGLPATYEIERIGGRRQILSDVMIGDPENPDFTAERIKIWIEYRLGAPVIGRIDLQEPRLYGSYRDGQLSFGSLDSVLFQEGDAEAGLPQMNVLIDDGRALIETDYGPIGVKLAGSGDLVDGFEGILAMTAPRLSVGDCDLRDASVFGDLTTSAGELRLVGPTRLASLHCDETAISVGSFAAQLDASSDDTLSRYRANAAIEVGGLKAGAYGAAGAGGDLRIAWRDDILDLDHTIALRDARMPQASAGELAFDGSLRARNGFEQVELRSEIDGSALRLGSAADRNLASLAGAGEGTLLGPLARQFATTLRREARGSTLEARLTARISGDNLTFVMPRAELEGGSGARILALSQVEYSSGGEDAPRLSGNIATGGPGMPRIVGRMERGVRGDAVFRLAMDEYSAGGSRLSVPSMIVAQGRGGVLGLSGEVVADGPLPGGSVSNLRVPVSGRYDPGSGLSLWRRCTDLSFDRLEMSGLAIAQRGLTVCPPRGGAIVRSDTNGTRIAAGSPGLDLQGTLGDTPIRIASGPIGLAYPGKLSARELDITLGPEGTASRFAITDLDAELGGEQIGGSFSDAEMMLDAVPMDIRNAAGIWAFVDGRFEIGEGSFRLLDREEPDRFEPLVARDARLALSDSIITANADLREPQSDRLVTGVDIRHDLTTGTGHADLNVPGLVFGPELQPADLTQLAFGVIANAEGVVTGTGRIDWNEREITSSGEFSSENLDFAAAFGPVKGASGTIVFDDLISLTTAPGQTLQIASVNPGIEVNDGEIEFALRDGQLLSVAGGSWPFMGGRLILRETDLNFGVSEERRYVFEIVGLDAGAFVERMELSNLSATGTFDGTVPIVFDEDGNGRIDDGLLISRPPGGNVAYVGELTYEDTGAVANFAFDALRSLDYNQMRVGMSGPLTGEIVTRVRFDGVSQGEGARQNFVTRRLGNIPLQFRINVRAQFYKLLTSMKSIYDPASVRDPRDLGLLSDDGTRLRRTVTGEEVEPDIDPDDLVPDERESTQSIQDQESENRR